MQKKFFTLLKLLTVLISSLLFSPTTQAIDVDPSLETARLLASQCAQCHGTTGNSLGDFDSIAGEDFQDLLNELLEMKADDDNEIMHKQIKAYTEKQIWYIADYYANLPKTSDDSDDDKDKKEDEEDEEDESDEIDEEDEDEEDEIDEEDD